MWQETFSYYQRILGGILLGLISLTLGTLAPKALEAASAVELTPFIGYEISDATSYKGIFKGSLIGDRIKLKNKMEFEFTSYAQGFSIDPQVVILRKNLSFESLPDSNTAYADFTLYQLIIGEQIYPVIRIK